MGLFIILSIISTYYLAQYYVEPEIVALIVLIITAVLFVISYVIVYSFEQVVIASQTKSEFVNIMSHELRSPLSAMKWQLNLIQRLKPNGEEILPMLSMLEEKNEEMIKLSNKLLEIDQIEGNGLVLKPVSFSLNKTIETVLKEQEGFAYIKDITLVKNLSGEPIFVFADDRKVKDVLGHLIDNAIRYSFKKGNVVISIEKVSGFAKCSITDNGIGISSVDAKKIFTKFFRNQSIVSYQTRGTGIGLFIAKAVIEASGGKIGFESIEGRGSTFWFMLPLSSEKKA
ncbi:MAG: HAMP domain-containing histidine kinase [Parcubacteria group bacterium]|nr:HAMP domain-containing histidine kinase [Parcubacteria group bacterium]MCR4342956.1 HAMP domain-containing histidine kinase [Patescibacteria group bacterium]